MESRSEHQQALEAGIGVAAESEQVERGSATANQQPIFGGIRKAWLGRKSGSSKVVRICPWAAA